MQCLQETSKVYKTQPLLVFFQQKIIATEIQNINWKLLGYIKNVHLETSVKGGKMHYFLDMELRKDL
ncbi:hypothetical protein P7K49_016746 [Saguinus oedipus]|uniref:Uncharacterized protein n=1 Tax=Saguinus oedipus TaxID=9490 RepID=A0ABQ9VDB9_SAGOE|nr:hypothetical protein P7K49_016746 [Saguinus oedipus]